MEDADLQKKWRALLIISVVIMVLAPLAYLYLIYLVKPWIRPTFDEFPMWLYILYALPMVDMLTSALTRKVWRRRLKKLAAEREPIFAKYRAYVIIRLAKVEASYIYGLIIFFLTGETNQLYYFYAVGILLTPFAWPRKEEYDNLAREVEIP